jgi:hypothetical protein
VEEARGMSDEGSAQLERRPMTQQTGSRGMTAHFMRTQIIAVAVLCHARSLCRLKLGEGRIFEKGMYLKSEAGFYHEE